MNLSYDILIVDDVSDNIKVAMNILKECNYNFSLHQHHEKYNGGAYPQGLKGEEIHIESNLDRFKEIIEA